MELIEELRALDYDLDDEYQSTFLSLVEHCEKEDMLRMTHIIVSFYLQNTVIKKNPKLPYGSQRLPLAGGVGCIANLEEMPLALRRLLYSYVHYMME